MTDGLAPIGGGRPVERDRYGAAFSASLVFVAVLGACLFGIWSRGSMPLASVWPPNALLLGMFLRQPKLRTPAAWAAAVVAYFVADLVTGNDLATTAELTVPNLVTPVVGLAIYRRRPESDRRLETPEAILCLFIVSVVSGVASAVPGLVVGIRRFDLSAGEAFATWAIAEITMCLSVLPIALSAPSWAAITGWVRERPWRRPRFRLVRLVWRLGPAIGLVALLVVGLMVGGPGSLMFCLPALLWSALRGSVFETACLAQLFAGTNALVLAFSDRGLVDIELLSSTERLSIHAGLAAMTLGPLAVAVTSNSRAHELKRTALLAERDGLTGVRTRRAFLEHAERARAHAVAHGQHLTVFMLDVDHFKDVNDQHGHAAGDSILRTLAEVLTSSLRETDITGRLGGEEFAAVLPGVQPLNAVLIADQVRQQFAAATIGQGSTVTVSIGVCTLTPAADDPAAVPHTLDELLALADQALYTAKRSGRNRVHVATPTGGDEA